jgi:hypothetical protein
VVTAAYGVQLAGWFGIAAWGLYKGTRPVLPLLLWCWVFFISQPMELPTAVELTRLLGFIGLYRLNIEADKLRRWADWCFPVVLGLTIILNRRGVNPNDISMMLWVTLMLGTRRGWWAVLAGIVMFSLGSEAALIALLVGLAVERWGFRVMLPAPVVMFIMGIVRGPGLLAEARVALWQYAISKFTWGGNGIPFEFHRVRVYSSYPIVDTLIGYTHSLPVDALYVAGLPGLGLLGVAGWWLWRNRAEFGPWSGFIAGFAVYSLVDYPHWSVPGAVLMIILSKYRKDQNYGLTMGNWIRMRVLESGGFGVGRSHRKGLGTLPDSHRPG